MTAASFQMCSFMLEMSKINGSGCSTPDRIGAYSPLCL